MKHAYFINLQNSHFPSSLNMTSNLTLSC